MPPETSTCACRTPAAATRSASWRRPSTTWPTPWRKPSASEAEFIANISHELKTPMTTIAGYTDGILDGTIPPEKERKYLQIISDESRRLSRLVRRMLDISQIQSQQDMKKEDFDLCEICAWPCCPWSRRSPTGAWTWRRTSRRIPSWSRGSTT
ncbi:MAG: histidine kinase dimerization/phospho-acceptor domain-containing protein [Oscillospiraceae bacterium]